MQPDLPSLSALTHQAEDLLAARKPLPTDPMALADRRSWLRRHLIEALGYMPPHDTPLFARMEALESLSDNLVQETVTYNLDLGGLLKARVIRPYEASYALPAVILLHGWDLNKSGLDAAAKGLAHAGYVVLVPEHQCVRGHAESCPNECPSAASLSPEMTYMGLTTHENIRSLDYLCSREDVDPDRVACVGVCWSGIQCYVLAALDERVKAACAVCGLAAQGTIPTDFAFMQGHMCLGSFLPGFLTVAGVQDLAALIAPRALLVQNNVTNEWYPVLSFRTARAETRMVYQTLGHPERFGAHVEMSVRDMTPEFTSRAVEWLGRFL